MTTKTLSDCMKECLVKAQELGEPGFIAIVTGKHSFLAVKVDEVLADGWMSNGVFRAFDVPFTALTPELVEAIRKKRTQMGDVHESE
jgi:hypothetical protein